MPKTLLQQFHELVTHHEWRLAKNLCDEHTHYSQLSLTFILKTTLPQPRHGKGTTQEWLQDLDEREELRATSGWGSLTVGQEKLLSDLAYTAPAALGGD